MKYSILFAFVFSIPVAFCQGPRQLSVTENNCSNAIAEERLLKLCNSTDGGAWLASQPSISFEQNKGQMADAEGIERKDILYRVSAPGLYIYVTTSGMEWQFFSLSDDEKKERNNKTVKHANFKYVKQRGLWHRVEMILKGAVINNSTVNPEDEIPSAKQTFYFSHCPDGISNVKSYRRITFKNIYPSVDWTIYSAEGKGLKHDFIVHPGADLSKIVMLYRGSGKFKAGTNTLSFTNTCGSLCEGNLYCYQGNRNNKIVSQYIVNENTIKVRNVFACEVKIAAGYYDHTKDLIIDPQLQWGTYYGGFAYDGVRAVTTDASGNVYIAGYSNSSNFLPALNPGGSAWYQGTNMGGYDIFLIKFNATGVLQWATQYGGTGDESALSLATDAAGNIYMTGYTTSGNLPVFNPGGSAYFLGTNAFAGAYGIFFLKFSGNGVRLWATYFGSGTGSDLTIDNNGNLFVTGYSEISGLPVINPGGGAYFQGANGGGSDIFILKFNNNNALVWSTYYGGTGYDLGYSIDNDAAGNIFVTGYTASSNLPTLNAGGGTYFQSGKSGFFDAFLLKFSGNGASLWATYYGGTGDEFGNDLTVDGNGNLFVTGATSSGNFPTQNAGTYYDNSLSGQHDIFIMKFSNTGIRQWSTLYGGSGPDMGVGDETGYSVASDPAGNIFVTGYTSSTNFPTMNPGGGAYFKAGNSGGPIDSYFLEFSNTGARLWATYNGTNDIDFGTALAIDNTGSVIGVGEWESSGSNGLLNPGGGSYYVSAFSGSDDSYIMKFGNPVPLPVELVSFTVKCHDPESVIVQWETLSETNNDFFSLQRSSDGLNFKTIGVVRGAGTKAEPTHYSFIDRYIYNDKFFYRLQQTDFNHKSSLSEVISLPNQCGETQCIVEPNPVQNVLSIYCKKGNVSEYKADIYNTLGSIVLQDVTGSADMSFLARGIYYLRLAQNSNIKFIKFIKQ